MYVSLPLSRILTKDEVRGVLGHELGHYKGQDTQFSTKFYPIYRGTLEGLKAIHATGAEGAMTVALIPAVSVLSFFLDAFAVAENEISRERELLADKVGASIVGSKVIATALVKICAYSAYWQSLRPAILETLREKKVFSNVSKLFAEGVKEYATLDSLKGLDERTLPHPTDSHPPLGTRLENLGVRLDEVQAAALQVGFTHSAIELIADHEAREERLSAAEQYLLARWAGIAMDEGLAQSPAAETGSTS